MLIKYQDPNWGNQSLKKGVMEGNMKGEMVNYPMFFLSLSTGFFVLSR